MISNKKAAASSAATAKVVGAKTARACDSCIKKRARWYCAADDAFLCQACDVSVHSANQLARRHERVRLKTASPSKNSEKLDKSSVSSWHQGFTKKPRTPRGKSATPRMPFPLVPEVSADDNNSYEVNEEEEQLLYRVPVFDPFVAELCTSPSVANYVDGNEAKAMTWQNGNSPCSHGFDLPSDTDDFAADVDSLLGGGFDDHECFGMEGLGLMDCHENNEEGRVKVEDEEDASMACRAESTEIDLMREPFELNLEDYDDSRTLCADEDEEGEDQKLGVRESHGEMKSSSEENRSCKKRKIFLRLDYDDVITKWDSQSNASPWTFGDRPDFESEFLSDHFWGTTSGAELLHYPCGDLNGGSGLHPAMIDRGREARVSRYKEKRSTRLFSKKIRYEVRKLNAEKRPRVKGRFVKRSSSLATSTFPIDCYMSVVNL